MMRFRSSESTVTPRASWIVLGLILLVQILSPMGYYGLSALAPFILEEWHISRQQFGLLLSAFSTGTFLLAFPAGMVTDRIGVGTILLSGQVGIGIFIALAPWLTTYFWVLTAMFLAGMGYGLVNPAGSKAVYSWFPPRRRAAALSLKQISLPLCGMVSGLVLPPLALLLGWQSAWMSIGIAVLAGAVLTMLLYGDPPAGETPPVPDPRQLSSSLSLLRHRNVLRLIGSGFLFTGMQISWHSYLAIYLKQHLGLTAMLAGSYIALMQGSAILGRPLLGVLSDRLFDSGRRGVLLMVGVVSGVLSLWFALLPSVVPAWVISLIVVLFGLTGVGWHGVHLTWLTEMAGPRNAGAAAGLWIGSAHLGIIVLVPLFGTLVDVTGSYTLGWVFTAALAFLATGVFWMIK